MEPTLPTLNNADSGTPNSTEPQMTPAAAPAPDPMVASAGQSSQPVSQPLSNSSQPTAATPTTEGENPQIADDVDVIEKEWVEKAKKIVSSSKSDPHQLEKEVSKLQADYLMKRYNKQIKLGD